MAPRWLDLAERRAEPHLHCQARLDRGITVVGLSATLASRPRLPVGAACHVKAVSTQAVSEPRRFGASLNVGEFLVLQAVAVGLLMPPSYHTGFTR